MLLSIVICDSIRAKMAGEPNTLIRWRRVLNHGVRRQMNSIPFRWSEWA